MGPMVMSSYERKVEWRARRLFKWSRERLAVPEKKAFLITFCLSMQSKHDLASIKRE